MSKTAKDLYRQGFDAGVKAKTDDIASNYDNWRRARDNQNIGEPIRSMMDLAVRQVIYGNELGKRPHED